MGLGSTLDEFGERQATQAVFAKLFERLTESAELAMLLAMKEGRAE